VTFRQRLLALAVPCLAVGLLAGRAQAADVFATVTPPAGAQLTRMADTETFKVILTLPLSDADGARRFGEAVTNPKSPLYGHYLTPQQYGQRFGADAATYEAVRSWAASQGLSVGRRTESRTTIAVRGTAAQFSRIFQTGFATFPAGDRGLGRVTLSHPVLPAALAGRVNGVIGLASHGHYAPLMKLAKAGPRADAGTGPGGYYAPTDITTAYDIPAQTNSTPTEVLAIFEQGGVPTNDITFYKNYYHLPNVPVTSVSVNGASTKPNIFVNLEVDLDIQVAIGLNPALKQILVYIDGDDDFQTALVDAINQIGDDNTAKVVSISYGQDENQQGQPAILAENTALMQLQAQGQSVFVSSGDDGAAGREGTGLNAPDPGSQPLVTSVGGTTLTTNPSTQAWVSETTWNGTGGGVSEIWSIPSYQIQKGVSVAVKNGGSATMRNVPDVAADADPNTGYAVYCKSPYGGWVGVGGTSLSAPIWATMTTIVNADRTNVKLPRVGFINPQLYKIAGTNPAFHDITVGNNGNPGFNAGPGYDNVTGWGSVDLGKILPLLLKK
jgi:subtilase family serine protease